MIRGPNVLLRPVRDEDWATFEAWGRSREALWGEFQRFQMDHLPMLRQVYQQTGMLTRDSGFLIVETVQEPRAVGFVRYTMLPVPDADLPQPEIGFGIADVAARGRGRAREAVGLLLDYLFSGHPAQRVTAFTDAENTPAQRLLEGLGFRREGLLRRSTFRDGRWCDIAIYAILRDEWEATRVNRS